MKRGLLPGGLRRFETFQNVRLDVYFGELSLARFAIINSQSSTTPGFRSQVDTMMLFDIHNMVSGGLVVRESPFGACLVSEVVSTIDLQASVNFDTTEIFALGPFVQTLDFNWLVYFHLVGDSVVRKTFRKIPLPVPELAAAMSYEIYVERIECLTGRLREELPTMSGGHVFDRATGDLVAEVEEDDPEGEVRPSAAFDFQAYVDVVSASRAADSTIDDVVSMEVDDSGEATFAEGLQAEGPPPSGGEQSPAAETN